MINFDYTFQSKQAGHPYNTEHWFTQTFLSTMASELAKQPELTDKIRGAKGGTVKGWTACLLDFPKWHTLNHAESMYVCVSVMSVHI